MTDPKFVDSKTNPVTCDFWEIPYMGPTNSDYRAARAREAAFQAECERIDAEYEASQLRMYRCSGCGLSELRLRRGKHSCCRDAWWNLITPPAPAAPKSALQTGLGDSSRFGAAS